MMDASVLRGILTGRKYPLDLLLVVLFSALGVMGAIMLPDGNVLRTALGILLMLFLPGYALVSVLWPGMKDVSGKGGIDNLERTALSIGISIAIISIVGLALSYARAFTQAYILIANFILILIFAGMAFFRRSALPLEKRYCLGISLHSTVFPNTGEKVLAAVITASLVFSACAVTYMLVTPANVENSTSFYMLDANGSVVNYPINITVNDTATVRVGIICHEHTTVNYTILTGIEGADGTILYGDWALPYNLTNNSHVGRNITLTNDMISEEEFSFRLETPGNYKLVWQLLMEGAETNYRMHRWVNVSY